jgi:hypothetical protein
MFRDLYPVHNVFPDAVATRAGHLRVELPD